MGVEIAGVDRLMLIHKVSLIMPLPVSYQAQTRSRRRASTLASHNTWFGGIYQDPPNLFARHRGRARAVPEALSGVQAAARADEGVARRSAGRDRRHATSAKRFGWKIGDRVPIQAHDLAAEAGPRPGTSTSSASTTATRASTRRNFFFRYDYLDENRRGAHGHGRLVHRQDRRPVARGGDRARRSTRMFANSSAETKTTTEKAFLAGLRQTDRRHRRDHDRDSRRGALHAVPAGRWPTRWRSRCASAPASWRC